MINNIQEREKRRSIILDGITGGLAHSKIAVKLGVSRSVLKKDLNRMRHKKDPELTQAYKKAQDKIQEKKIAVANIPGERFHRMTGMTFKEKASNNMMSYYEPELMKILKAKNECDAIRGLSTSIRKTLKRNGIIAQGWKTPELTRQAREYLTRR